MAKVKHIKLHEMWFRYKDLTNLTLRANRATRTLYLSSILLLDGCWANLLDALRYSDVIGARAEWLERSGCVKWTDGEWGRIFCSPGVDDGSANLYIQGHLKHNQLRKSPPGVDLDSIPKLREFSGRSIWCATLQASAYESKEGSHDSCEVCPRLGSPPRVWRYEATKKA